MSLDKHRNPNGTYDGVGVMAEISGLGRDEIKAIAEQVKANQAKLDSCAYHEFERDPATAMLRSLSHQRFVCKHCGGSIRWDQHHWHELGRRAKPKPAVAYSFEPVPGSTCSRELAAAGKPYPKTCQVHGLTCGVKQP